MEASHDLQPDIIFFTGDVAFGQLGDKPGYAIRDQFNGAEEVFNGVRTAFSTEVPRHRFFIIPGNHDVNRDDITDDQTQWLDNLTDENAIISLMHLRKRQWQRYMERLNDYKDFLRSSGYDHLLIDPDYLIYGTTVNIRDINVGICGLNSAWSCGREKEKGKLWMGGRWQVERLVPLLASADLKVALVHHPAGWLVSNEDPNVRRIIERDFDFCLHGHEHQEWVERAERHTRIAAGACYDESQSENGYNFVRLNLATGDGEVWLRRYHTRGGGWVPEAVPGKTNNDGMWRLSNIPKLERTAPVALNVLGSQASSQDEIDTRTGTANDSTQPSFAPSGRPFLTYGSDLPPIVDAWVGRERELSELESQKSGVVVVTGIGGQGKSTTVAKFLENWRMQNPDGFWDWRDCREEGERFHTQLVAMIENLTAGAVTSASLAEADTKAVVRYFFELAANQSGVIVLDNVDHYVNVQDNTFEYGVSTLVQEALRVQHAMLFVLTCRPRVEYASPRFSEIQLRGLELEEAVALFQVRGLATNVQENHDRIKEIWLLTQGHPLWLNLIAVQMARNPGTSSNIVQELRKGHVDGRTRSMFKALWSGLNDRQQSILRCMAEITYPESMETIEVVARPIIKNWNHFNRAFNGLRALSLVIERGSTNKGSKFDLHPLVRNYIRTEYPSRQDRRLYLESVLLFLQGLFKNSNESAKDATLELLERWTTKVELELASGNTNAAIDTLARAADPLVAKGYHEEFFRVAKLVLDEADWANLISQEIKGLAKILDVLITTLAEHGREEDARHYLRRYEEVSKVGTVAHIRLSKITAYIEWFLGNYDSAILWGRIGEEVKSQSHIDTEVDTINTLALALRDSGRWDEALSMFAPTQTADEILSKDYRSSGKSAEFYGNVGRCFQYKGNLGNALQCYTRAAALLEEQYSSRSVLNRGYASLWIGEVLQATGDYNNAFMFYQRSVYIWSTRAPLKVPTVEAKVQSIAPYVGQALKDMSMADIESFCVRWIKDHVD
jgi:tetratricopeptide (TPR) repeat protein/calcineurin-like phosphoesterase family protein